tara:strand:+ start:676 stop:1458 length:783 start_codon:yes stop_codon:yes gene_type:complete
MFNSKKSLGQNFLVDKNIIKKITNLVDIKNKNVLEIGPGKGSLTNEILKKKPKGLILVEKDNHLTKNLQEKYNNEKNIKIFNDDILRFNIERKIKPKTIIFGNLPYNISSQILVRLIKFEKWPPLYTDLILMFQKELAQKITGKFMSSNYGRISVLTSYRLKLINKFFVSNTCFVPAPKIMSNVLHLKPIINNKENIKKIDNLEKVTNVLFSNRRKMINKNLKKLLNENKIKLLNLDLKKRPSDLKPQTYFKITKLFESS